MPPFHLHPLVLVVTVLVAGVHLRVVRERARRWRAVWGWLVWALVVLWPIGDLAASVSLSVATLQRLVLMLGVDYVLRLEWRDPVVAVVQIPYLALFFGSILLMGLPMYSSDRRRWRVTAATTALLLAAMLYAMWRGVG